MESHNPVRSAGLKDGWKKVNLVKIFDKMPERKGITLRLYSQAQIHRL
jgi:hypothetical protein